MSKQRLIFRYHMGSEFSGNDYVLPAEYESAEALLCDFKKACKAAYMQEKRSFIFLEEEFNVNDFYFLDSNTYEVVWIHPDIYTIDEWFEQAPDGKIYEKDKKCLS